MKKLLLSALMLMLAIPAFAFDVPMPEGMKLNIYGQVRMAAFYQGTNASKGSVNDTNGDFRYLFQTNSRLGFNLAIENFFATVELNVKPDQAGSPIGFRQFYAGYKFNNGVTFLAGNKTTLGGNTSYSDVYFGDNGLNGFGAIGDTRRPMVMVSYAGLDVAIVSNETDANTVTVTDGKNLPAERITSSSKAEFYMPRFEVAYNMKYSNLSGKVFAAYGLFTEKIANEYHNINAFHVGFFLKPQFGKFYMNFGAFYAMNAGMYNAVKVLDASGKDVTNVRPSFDLNADGGVDTNNVNTWGVAAAFGMKINPMFTVELGGGYQDSRSDQWISIKDGDTANLAGYAVYFSSPININKHIQVTPQIGYYGRATDAMIGGSTSVETLMAGAQLKLMF